MSETKSNQTSNDVFSHQEQVQDILATIESVVLGKPKACKLALACLLAQGHLLIEDLPGMGKTTLAHTLATTLGLSYQRTQFTNDMLPADVVGFSIYNKDNHSFELHKGPIFNQVVLADEINRASPKTQSALLEAMAEHQVSIDGTTYTLPNPFFVIATQNPIYHAGTYPLPESQLDRFMMRLSLGFPDMHAEKQILLNASQRTNQVSKGEEKLTEDKLADQALISPDILLAMQNAVSEVSVSNDVIDYILALSHVTRTTYQQSASTNANNTGQLQSSEINCKPLSPRATKALLQAAKAIAFIENRDYVLPDDVQAVFFVVCQHRIELQPSANISLSEQDENSSANQVLNSVDVLNPLSH